MKVLLNIFYLNIWSHARVSSTDLKVQLEPHLLTQSLSLEVKGLKGINLPPFSFKGAKIEHQG